MSLDKYYKKVKQYERLAHDELKQSRKQLIKIIGVVIIGGAVLIIMALEWIDASWYRIFKIKAKYFFLKALQLSG